MESNRRHGSRPRRRGRTRRCRPSTPVEDPAQSTMESEGASHEHQRDRQCVTARIPSLPRHVALRERSAKLSTYIESRVAVSPRLEVGALPSYAHADALPCPGDLPADGPRRECARLMSRAKSRADAFEAHGRRASHLRRARGRRAAVRSGGGSARGGGARRQRRSLRGRRRSRRSSPGSRGIA